MSVYSIVGTKGGTAKSTTAMGLSIWMTELEPDERVLLIDGDMHVRSVELKMCPTHDVTLKDVISGDESWKKAVYTSQLEKDGDLLYPNLAVLPAGGKFMPPIRGSPSKYLNTGKKIFNRMIKKLRKKFEYIIIDTPASVSLEHLILTASADGVIYACEPNDDSINSTKTTAEELNDFMDINTLGVALCRVPEDIQTEEWIEKAEEIAPVLGVVPEDPNVGKAFRKNLPVVAAYPDSPASQAMQEIAEELLERKVERTELSEKIDQGVKKISKKTEEN